MTPEQLKASILQYAIQGKLVEQRAEEGTGEELFQEIKRKREVLIKEKIIKKDKRTQERPYIIFSDKLITDAVAREIVGRGAGCLKVDGHVIITPSAKDTLKQAGMEIEICGGR